MKIPDNTEYYEETISELNTKIGQIERDKEDLKNENQALNTKLSLKQTEKEDLESTINSLKKKVQSLVQENAKLIAEKEKTLTLPPSSSTIWSFPLSPLFTKPQGEEEKNDTINQLDFKDEPGSAGECAKLKEKISNYEDEIKQLKEKNNKLTISLET